MNWSLPKEILAIVFLNLGCNEVFKALSINKYWYGMRDYESLWKDLVFSGAFPHYYQRSDVANWKNIVRNFAETRKNLMAGRFTLETIAARAPAVEKWSKDIFPATCSVYDKYCLLTWSSIEREEDTAGFDTFSETELWDLDTKQKIKSYPRPKLRFSGSYVVDAPYDEIISSEDTKVHSAPFDLNNDLQFKELEITYGMFKENCDTRSQFIVGQDFRWADQVSNFGVLDLSTGKAVLKKEIPLSYLIDGTCDNKLIYHNQDDKSVHRIDVIEGTEDVIAIKAIRHLVLTTYEEIISIDAGYIYRVNLRTKEEKKIPINKKNLNWASASEMCLINGVIAVMIKMDYYFVDPNDGSFLHRIKVEGLGNLKLMQAFNGKYVLSQGGNSASVLSFKDEDIYRPIEILEVKTTGETNVHKIVHGSLYESFSQMSAYTSLLVHETATERYSLVHAVEPQDALKHNPFATKLLQQGKITTPNHKAVTIQRVLKPHHGFYVPYTRLSMRAYGDCFVVYEKLTDGKWRFSGAPNDQWQTIYDQMK